MSNYNYKEKLDYRYKLMSNIKNNSSNKQNLSMQEWYQTYMPFLPKEVLNIIPELEKEKMLQKEQEESLEYLKILFG